MIRQMSVACAVWLLLAACGSEGPQGPAGENGTAGEPGTPCHEGLADHNGDGVVDTLDCRGDDGDDGLNGRNGSNGAACWDLNGNGTPDLLTEDRTGDGLVDVLDCQGAAGQDGQGYAPPTYVGWQACATCHQALYDKVARSGHAHALRVVAGARPANLQQNLSMTQQPANGNAPTDPPAGYTWDDIAYVIGGWGWMTRFVDQQGYLVTCPKGDVDSDGDGFCDVECGGTALTACGSPGTDFAGQWNQVSDTMVPYDRGEFAQTFDCAPCHTTGYDPTLPTLDASGQTMHGIQGAWHDEGVKCERCHGPGSRHIGDPRHERMIIDRDPEQCGRCHSVGNLGTVLAGSDGFAEHAAQWNELYTSKKHAMRCIDCHDPHRSANFRDNTHNPATGLNLGCDTCHFEQKARQNNTARTGTSPMAGFVKCGDCHMPYLVKSAAGNLGLFTGDVRSHLFAVNTDAAATQFNTAGTQVMPYVTLTWACRSCHAADAASNQGQMFSNKTDAELEASADGYHD